MKDDLNRNRRSYSVITCRTVHTELVCRENQILWMNLTIVFHLYVTNFLFEYMILL